jgi:DNA-directed RNA polymerase specialized sigma24 family protein
VSLIFSDHDAVDVAAGRILELIDGRDFLSTHLPRLDPKQRRTLLSWADGRTYAQIAAAEQIGVSTVHRRLAEALATLRDGWRGSSRAGRH